MQRYQRGEAQEEIHSLKKLVEHFEPILFMCCLEIVVAKLVRMTKRGEDRPPKM